MKQIVNKDTTWERMDAKIANEETWARVQTNVRELRFDQLHDEDSIRTRLMEPIGLDLNARIGPVHSPPFNLHDKRKSWRVPRASEGRA